jgi:pimeloyl-ACP methyl ester carboxylesterase
METSFSLSDATFRSTRHTTHYWQAGPAGGPLMIFLHGWPEIGLVWRAQMEAFASEGMVRSDFAASSIIFDSWLNMPGSKARKPGLGHSLPVAL